MPAEHGTAQENGLGFDLRRPDVADAPQIFAISRQSDRVDVNSLYGYALLCRDFSSTSLVAVSGDELIGYAIGYRRPERQNTYFSWQWATTLESEAHSSLIVDMLANVVRVELSRGCDRFETTIATASGADETINLVDRLASRFGSRVHREPLFDSTMLGEGHGAEDHFAFDLSQ